MQKTIQNILKVSIGASLATAFLFANPMQIEAATTTYIVDPTGQGCGNLCGQLRSYLNATNNNMYHNASSTTNNNGNTTNTNNGTPNPNGNAPTSITSPNGTQNGSLNASTSQSGNPGYAPYQIYRNFEATDMYYKSNTASTGPTSVYKPYPNQMYVYYNKNTGSQYNPSQVSGQGQYARTNVAKNSNLGNSQKTPSNTGFVMTSSK